MINSRLCLIDANSLFYRAYFAIKAPLTTSSGQPTNAVFGFVKMVHRLMEELEPQYLGVCFDVGKVTHRTEKFAAYKIHRPPMPDALVSQLPYIKEVVQAYNFPVFEKDGFEADDVIATLARKAAPLVLKVVIVSSDKDILQLVGGNIEVYNPYKEEGIVFSEDAVKEKLGVEPSRILDLIALMGDASDNIPGAKGIGEKTARGLLTDFADVEDLLQHRTRIKGEHLRKIVEENAETIRLSRDLARLCVDVDLDFDLKNMAVRPPDNEKLWDVFSRLEFKGMLKNLSQERLSSQKTPSLDVTRRPVDDEVKICAAVKKKGLFAFFVSRDEEAGSRAKMNFAFDDEAVYETSDAAFIKKLFALSPCVAVGHDVKAGLHFLRRSQIEPLADFFDTMLAAHLLESSRAALELEAVIWDHLGLKALNRLDYLGKESHFLLKLKSVLAKGLKDKGLEGLFYKVEMPLVSVLFQMESDGVAIDLAVLKKLSKELEKKLAKAVASIYKMADGEFNINSPKQLSEILFSKLKLPVIKKTKTGVSTDEEVLTRLSRDYELPRVLLEYRQISKLKATYVDALPGLIDKKTGKIHSSFHQAGTETGRLSSSNPNLQNIPVKTELGRTIRQAFIPSEGFDSLLSADYSQVELRILAHLSGDEVLCEAFQKDRDIHRTTAALIFGIAERDVSDEMRENAKRVNFGIVYGMSAYGLAKDLSIDPGQAQVFIDEYFARYPRVKAYLDAQVAFVKKHGYVATLLGRRRYIPEIHNANFVLRQFAERQAVNAPIQGSAADLIKCAMIELCRRLKQKGLKSRLILQVHDELLLEVKKGDKKNAAALVRDSMENILKLNVPLKVVLRSGKNWLQMQEREELKGEGKT